MCIRTTYRNSCLGEGCRHSLVNGHGRSSRTGQVAATGTGDLVRLVGALAAEFAGIF